MKKHLLFLFAALLPLMASAMSVEIDGIWYYLKGYPYEAEVIESGGTDYTGAITIPATVTYDDVTYSVTSIGDHAFSDCYSLTAINIPEGVTSIGERAFYGCSRLTSINIPEGVTSIGVGTFSRCSSLTGTFTIPESVTSIGDSAFENCISLTAINIPEGVTSIGNSAFAGCSSLTAITIPEGVMTIGNWAFYYCRSLTAITCHGERPPRIYSSDTFSGVSKSIPIYVPAGSVDDYKMEKYWREFTNILSIEEPAITITINQYGSGTYSSEFALDFSNVKGLKAYAATGYDSETGIVTLTRVMTAKAGEGIFVKGESGVYVVPILESTSFNTLNLLVGTLEKITLNSTSADDFYANYKYTIKEGDAEPLFYQFADGSTFGASKAYLRIPTAWLPTTTEARSIRYRFDEGEGTTDIENSEFRNQNSEITYDLYGRKAENPMKGGIYIVNGKKVIVK